MAAGEDMDSDKQRPRDYQDEHVNDMNALCRARGPGGHIDLQEASRCIEDDWSYTRVVDDGEIDEIHHGNEGSQRVVETNARSRDSGPAGLEGMNEVK